MSKKSIAAVLIACTFGLLGGATGIYSLVGPRLTGSATTTPPPPPPSPPAPTTAALDELRVKLFTACAAGELRGVWIPKIESSTDGDRHVLVLHGILDEESQRLKVKGKVEELLQEIPALKAVNPKVDVGEGRVDVCSFRGELPKLKAEWDDPIHTPPENAKDDEREEWQLKRQTRLDDVSFVFPDKLQVTGVCLATRGNVTSQVIDALEALRKIASTSGQTTLVIDGTQIKTTGNPASAVEMPRMLRKDRFRVWHWIMPGTTAKVNFIFVACCPLKSI